MPKPRIAVLIGGPSREHEVSKLSAAQLFQAVDHKRYDIRPILVASDLTWRIYPSHLGYEADTPQMVLHESQVLDQLPYLVDAAFIAMHGEYGEDGTVQRLLDRATIPYQGSGPRASALAFDKAASYAHLRRLGFAIPDYSVMTRAEWVSNRAQKVRQLISALGRNLVVKPSSSGSSVGVFIIQSPSELADALEQVSIDFDRFIIQRYIDGAEITCAVIESNEGPVAMPPTLIRQLRSGFFSYDAKYTPGAAEEITPAPFNEATLAAIQKTALAAHRAHRCRDYSRSDFILANGRLWLLEINTLPGLTATSLLPQAAEIYGLSYQALIHHLIERARHRPEVIELS